MYARLEGIRGILSRLRNLGDLQHFVETYVAFSRHAILEASEIERTIRRPLGKRVKLLPPKHKDEMKKKKKKKKRTGVKAKSKKQLAMRASRKSTCNATTCHIPGGTSYREMGRLRRAAVLRKRRGI